MYDEFILNSLPKIDPVKEQQLTAFLETPIDSRMSIESEPNLPPITSTRKLQTECTKIDEDWNKWFQRIAQNAHHCHHCGVKLTLTRCIKKPDDPLHRMSVEDIKNARDRTIRGPTLRMKSVPYARRIDRATIVAPFRSTKR